MSRFACSPPRYPNKESKTPLYHLWANASRVPLFMMPSPNIESVLQIHIPRDNPGRLVVFFSVRTSFPVIDPRHAPRVLGVRIGVALLPDEAELDGKAAVDELALTLVSRVPRRAADLDLKLRLVEALALPAVEARGPNQLGRLSRDLKIVEEIAIATDRCVLVVVDLRKKSA